MNLLTQIGEWIDRLTPLLGLLFAFVTWFAGLMQQDLIAKWKKKRFTRLLGLKKDVPSEVILPIRYGCLQQKFLGQNEFTVNQVFSYITLEESHTAMALSRLIPEEKICLLDNLKHCKTVNNKFCLGSVLSNDYIIRFLRAK